MEYTTLEPRTCLRCKGVGTTTREAWTYTAPDGKTTHYPEVTRPCSSCKGDRQFAMPDFKAIAGQIKGRKGGVRSARPKYELGARPYFVWRMARFHAGIDTTMPMAAFMDISGDPWEKELDYAARLIAGKISGDPDTGVNQWRRALGYPE